MSNYRITAIDGWYRVRGLDNTIHGAGCTVDDAITEAIESIEGRVERAVHGAERAEARVKEIEASLRRVREKSIMALSSLSIASKTLREIDGVGK